MKIQIDKATIEQAIEYIAATNKSSEFWLVPGSKLNQVVTSLKAALTTAPLPPPPECQTEAEKIAYSFGWWKALEVHRVAPAYGIIDPDYARVYSQARAVAWQYGYACIMHGSFTRDLDLLLVPWTKEARGNDEQLLKLIAGACDMHFRDGVEPIHKAVVDWTEQPHGRKSTTLLFKKFGDRRWVDISVMPIKEQP